MQTPFSVLFFVIDLNSEELLIEILFWINLFHHAFFRQFIGKHIILTEDINLLHLVVFKQTHDAWQQIRIKIPCQRVNNSHLGATLPLSSTVYLMTLLLCISLWHSRHNPIRLSQFNVTLGSLMLCGVKKILWCTSSIGL